MAYKTYEDRRKAFSKFEGEKVRIVASHDSYLHEGDKVTHIPYKTSHIGKVKNGSFIEAGKRKPYSFMVSELVSIEKYNWR